MIQIEWKFVSNCEWFGSEQFNGAITNLDNCWYKLMGQYLAALYIEIVYIQGVVIIKLMAV